ncbi:hypothetical protein DM035_22975 [Salmonella enterica subsp. enterica serovar Kottbus]|uniref:Uncharacterized protein n=1 Tax=Salmonella enterica subsp. enterica serovar Kottbus TaxID=224727 RepID=A0A5U6MFV6_SALET|nr:hypothetical protein [Salmonella enterica subsp. enterica serovar Kottbus]
MMAGWRNYDHWSAPHFDVYGFRRSDLKTLAEKLGMDLSIPLDEITPGVPEPTDSKLLSGADVEMLRMEIDMLKRQVRKLESERPILIKKYREDDPLFLAIQIRNKEWSRYDHDNDRATRANQASIKQELENMGFTSRQAESIELVACPIKRG